MTCREMDEGHAVRTLINGCGFGPVSATSDLCALGPSVEQVRTSEDGFVSVVLPQRCFTRRVQFKGPA